MGDDRRIAIGTSDGEPVTLPVVEVLTGRAAILGKSGSGKSNSVSVVVEELLEQGYPVLIVDTDGEYYGLKEEYELLHAGADEECDIRVAAEHAEKIANLALEENVPVILDVSGYLDGDEADALVRETARHLFAKEKKLKKPFLLVVEEVHEYIPEGGGMDETGRMLIKVGKRGRKHGLGIVGISQRPADVKKDFITQANWLVWHRLTWENDTNVVGRVVGEEYADAAADLDDGEAFVGRDWTEDEVARVQFDRKRTFDAGATPGLEDVERPELKSVSDALVDELGEISARRDRREDRIEELEDELAARNERIAELEEELRSARNVSRAATRMADALSEYGGRSGGDRPFGFEERLRQKNERIRELEAEIGGPGATAAEPGERPGSADGHREDGAGSADEERGPEVPERGVEVPEGGGSEVPGKGDAETSTPRGVSSDVDEHVERLRRRGERLLAADDASPLSDVDEVVELLRAEPVAARVDGARRESRCNREHTWAIIAALAAQGGLALQEIDPLVDPDREAIESLLSELRTRSLVSRDSERRYALDRDAMRSTIEEDDGRAALGELASQWRS